MSAFQLHSEVWPGLGKLAEEAGEAGQVCGKLIATGGAVEHWDGSNLADRLEDELGDLLAAVRWVIRENGLDESKVRDRADLKVARFEAWTPTPGVGNPSRRHSCQSTLPQLAPREER